MAEYESARPMPAEAEVVFDVAADVDLMDRWLPSTMVVEPAGPNVVHVEADVAGQHHDTEGLFRARPDQLRLEWGSRDTPDYAGWLQVAHGDTGTSEATLHLSFLGDQPPAHGGAAADQVRAAMDDALRDLERQVTFRVGYTS